MIAAEGADPIPNIEDRKPQRGHVGYAQLLGPVLTAGKGIIGDVAPIISEPEIIKSTRSELRCSPEVTQERSIEVTHAWNRIVTGLRHHHPRRRLAAMSMSPTWRYHPRRRRAAGLWDFVRGMGSGLPCRSGALEIGRASG